MLLLKLSDITFRSVLAYRTLLTTRVYYTRRIEPNSRTTLIDEQSNPSQLVHQEDVMSRHRNLL